MLQKFVLPKNLSFFSAATIASKTLRRIAHLLHSPYAPFFNPPNFCFTASAPLLSVIFSLITVSHRYSPPRHPPPPATYLAPHSNEPHLSPHLSEARVYPLPNQFPDPPSPIPYPAASDQACLSASCVFSAKQHVFCGGTDSRAELWP